MANTSDSRQSADRGEKDRVRLDQWLWAARFFKTRTLAAAAISGGKVHVGGQRAKPSRAVHWGETLQIQRGFDEYVVKVTALSVRRGPARNAVLLYEETAESRQRREEQAEQRRLQHLAELPPMGRPTKQDRRRIVHFTRQEK
jgi:ribosome-associated heat shock protein Hsp15